MPKEIRTLNENPRYQWLAAIAMLTRPWAPELRLQIKNKSIKCFLNLAWVTSNTLLLLASQNITPETRNISWPWAVQVKSSVVCFTDPLWRGRMSKFTSKAYCVGNLAYLNVGDVILGCHYPGKSVLVYGNYIFQRCLLLSKPTKCKHIDWSITLVPENLLFKLLAQDHIVAYILPHRADLPLLVLIRHLS